MTVDEEAVKRNLKLAKALEKAQTVIERLNDHVGAGLWPRSAHRACEDAIAECQVVLAEIRDKAASRG